MTEGNHEAGATDVTVRHVRRTRRICVHNATEIGALVRLARQRLGMSQTDAAICCGVGRRFLVELENGKPTVQLDKMLVVLDALGIGLMVRGPGVSFTAETYKVLSENPKINGVKEASGNFSLLAHTRYLCPDDFYIWSGNDDQVVPMMSLGAKGVISVVSNIAPEVMVKMSHLCLEGNFEEAAKLQIQYMDLIDALFCEVNPIPVKTAMNLMGMEAGPLRLPLCEMSEKNQAVLRASMERMGLL